MRRTPRQRAFELDPTEWQPEQGSTVFVRSRNQHLSRVCGRGTVLGPSLFPELYEVTIKAGTRQRTELWNQTDLRPCTAKDS